MFPCLIYILVTSEAYTPQVVAEQLVASNIATALANQAGERWHKLQTAYYGTS